MKHDLIIVGGGAAGLMAAITAKDMGMDTAILEGNDRVGKKILVTGNGRCNISNKFIEDRRYHSDNPEFFKNVLSSFTLEDTKSFFLSLGLPIVTLEGGKMYPMSLQASSVIDIVRLALSDRDIPVYYNSKVKEIFKTKSGFEIKTSDNSYYCNKLILCTGGKSASATGSDGSGYSLAKSLGHKIINPVPALVQLKLDYKNLKALAGIKFDGFVELYIDGISKRKEFGEILFTDYGISGPPILQLSRIASYSISKAKTAVLRVTMIYTMSPEDLENFLESHWAMFGHRSVNNSFIGIINKKMIPILLKEANISNIHKSCFDLDWKEKKAILSLLQNWEFTITDTNAFANAQVTAGGIDTTDVNPETLESKLVSNLYFAGEVLDVDGDCGGFNLQWAWSSGFIAGKSACSKR